ncbi:methyltransferase domain-containing protein [Desulfobacula sp.]
MAIKDKKNILKNINNPRKISLELGCGNRKRHGDAVGIDKIEYDGVDILGDVYEVLRQIPDNRISAVYSYHFFEHIDDVEKLVSEVARVLVDKGLFIVVVPHFSNPYFYSDYTHLNHFGLYSFSYFAQDNIFYRKVPHYQKTINFKLQNVELIFKSPKPFYFRWGFKKIVQLFFNLNIYLKEFYEEFFCYLIPCYEIKYSMEKTPEKTIKV